jgi:hypothetical protein
MPVLLEWRFIIDAKPLHFIALRAASDIAAPF